MGQLIDWPEVVTEGADLDECRAMLRDAAREKILAYQELGREIPEANGLIEQLPVEMDLVGQAMCTLIQKISGTSPIASVPVSELVACILKPGTEGRLLLPPIQRSFV